MYYANLVGWIGCHADSHELWALFGDDIAYRADTYAVDMAGLPFLRLMMSHRGRGLPGGERGIRSAAFLVTARSQVARMIHSHCSSALVLSDRMGLDPQVREDLGYIFERWDGRGLPNGTRGEDIPVEIYIVHVADVVEVHLRTGGVEQAVDVLRSRRGTQFSPAVVEVFESDPAAIVDGLLEMDLWTAALAQAPDRDRILDGNELDELLRAMADFVDLKCPFTFGHSRGVADLVPGRPETWACRRRTSRGSTAPDSCTASAEWVCPTRSGRRRGRQHGRMGTSTDVSISDRPDPEPRQRFGMGGFTRDEAPGTDRRVLAAPPIRCAARRAPDASTPSRWRPCWRPPDIGHRGGDPGRRG